jgi:HEAT repeat protein
MRFSSPFAILVVSLSLARPSAAQTKPAGGTADAQQEAQAQAPSPADLRAAIDQLGAVEYPVRMAAARRLRRAPVARVVPALLSAVETHKDGYVRYRALILLTGFADPRTPPRMVAALTDPNDRLRQLACEYFEHDVDAQRVPALLKALEQESGEFVRPALLRALAAHGADPRVREALVREIPRGETLFRSALIEALGDYRADYAVPALMETVQLEGPLQVDAAIALGKIGDKRALNAVIAAQRAAPESVQPQIAAAICLLGTNCAAHVAYIDKALRFAAGNAGFQPLLRSAAAGAAALALRGNADAANLLFDVGGRSDDPARAPLALAVGTIALRDTAAMLALLEKRTDRDAAVLLLRDAFDMLEEPYGKERFFVAVRRAYWNAAEGSDARKVVGLLIEKLEF